MFCRKNWCGMVLLLGLSLTACGNQIDQDSANDSGAGAEAQTVRTEAMDDLWEQGAEADVLETQNLKANASETQSLDVEGRGESSQSEPHTDDTSSAAEVITVYTTEKPRRSSEKFPVVYTDDLSLLDQMGQTDYSYAYRNGDVYYRQYHKDSYEEGALWGNYRATAGTDKEIVRINADGEKTVLFHDKGYGDIYLMGERFYMTDLVTRKDEDWEWTCTNVYSVDMQGENRIDYGENGSICFVDRDSNSIVMEFYVEDTAKKVFTVLNAADGEQTALPVDTADYCCFWDYHDGWCYFEEDTGDGLYRIVAVSLEGERREIIALTSHTEEEYGYREYICDLRVEGERIYIVFGGYAGSGNFYQGGGILTTKLDGSDYRAIESTEDRFYVRQEQGRPLLYYPHHGYDDGEQAADSENDYETTVWDVERNITYPCEFPVQLINSLDRQLVIGELERISNPICVYQRSTGGTDFYALPDDSGRIVRAVMRIDEDITPLEGMSAPGGEEYEIDYQHLFYADGYLYFEAEFNVYDMEYAIGWRDGYRRIQTDVYRRRLADGEMELLYSY